MTRTASLLPDSALPPDSLVGRMLSKPTFTPKQADDLFVAPAPPPAMPEPLPLWRVMAQAWSAHVVMTPDGDRMATAAEIEALRDWLLPEEPEPRPTRTDRLFGTARESYLRWHERQRLRALLTEQAAAATAGPSA